MIRFQLEAIGVCAGMLYTMRSFLGAANVPNTFPSIAGADDGCGSLEGHHRVGVRLM